MIKNFVVIILFILTNLLEVGLLKPFFTHFLFLNIVLIVVLATDKKFLNQALFLGFLYGVILNILFSSNVFVMPLILVIAVFVINRLSLWFGQRLFQKLIYTLLLICILRIFFERASFNQMFGYELLFAMVYTTIANYLFYLIKDYVDF